MNHSPSQHHTHYAQASPSRTVVITYMARRSSIEWPEKKFCDSKESFFLCELWKNFGIRALGRVIHNDKVSGCTPRARTVSTLLIPNYLSFYCECDAILSYLGSGECP
jgi:hypothetical protein